ncbi:WAT1-related protein [Dioscorea alata]|uniref:WAT1-related protein n=1 Tax=Dioscorea alata TaxID=55571 RepID=A0ACB7V9B6_DIOAL|nr:WAT1-related protein [Dioscorea alata]
MDVHKPFIPYLAMILARILFAGIALFTKTAVAGGMNPFVFVFYRQIFASLVLIPVIFFFERNKSLPPLPLFRIFIISFCGITLSSFLYTLSLRYTSATFAAAAANAVPAITLLLALILRIEKLKKKHKFSAAAKLLGTLLCLVGAFLFALYKGPAVQFINHHEIQKPATSPAEKVISRADWVKGSLLMLLAQTCWSIWLILQTGLITVIFERKPSSWKLGWNSGLLASVYSGAATAVCSWLMTWCVDCKGALFTAVFSPLTFLTTVVYSIVFWNEILHWGSVGGAVMLVLGLYCVLWGKHKESSSSSPKQAQEMSDNMGH